MRQPASIFNDVLGPIMTGPSSSHTAGPCRIGLLGHQLCGGTPRSIEIRFDQSGSFAATYQNQGTDRGLVGGLLGIQPDEIRLHTALKEAADGGIRVCFTIGRFECDHPNTAKLTLHTDAGERLDYTGKSTGGGMFQITEINGFSVELRGDCYELLVVAVQDAWEDLCRLLENTGMQTLSRSDCGDSTMLNAKFKDPVSPQLLQRLSAHREVRWLRQLTPVLPILSGPDCAVPFLTNQDMMSWIAQNKASYWEAGLFYEAQRGQISQEYAYQKMEHIADVMQESVFDGLEHPREGQILHPRAADYAGKSKDGKLLPLGVMDTAIAWAMAVVEVNSRYGRLVAAPTGGACGVIPGAILGTAHALGLPRKAVIQALFAAGIVGVFIAEHATFAAELCGCQAECGAGSAMAAAGVVQLYGGTPMQCAAAASMALQNVLGMICDSVADLVEVPCLGRNVLGAVNAITCANMALAGVEEIVPLDETIQAMLSVGQMMPNELCCTGQGGLAITETSRCIKKKLTGC